MGAGLRHTGDSASRSLAPPLGDCLLAAILCAAFEVPALGDATSFLYVPTKGRWIWAAVGGVMTLAVAARRWRPLWVWVIATACGAFLLAARTQIDPFVGSMGWAPMVFPAPLVALYTVTRTAP